MHTINKYMGHNESGAKRKVNITKCLHEEIKVISWDKIWKSTKPKNET